MTHIEAARQARAIVAQTDGPFDPAEAARVIGLISPAIGRAILSVAALECVPVEGGKVVFVGGLA